MLPNLIKISTFKILILYFTHTFCQPQTNFQLYGLTKQNCADNLPINPYLNWYGLFSTDSGELLRKLDITKIDSLSSESKIIFLLGSENTLIEDTVSFIAYKDCYHTYFIKSYFPGDRTTIYSGINTAQIRVTGNVKGFNGDCAAIEDYRFEIFGMGGSTWQNLLPDITEKGSCGIVDLAWFGDVDQDKMPDLLIRTSKYNSTHYNLFLSSIAESGKVLKHVGSFSFGSCY